MHADSIFQQGFTHEVCEDYALNGENYAIIADGCSTGQHTDWGSRLLCKAAEQHIGRQKKHPMQFFQAVGGTALAQCSSFPNLPESCLTATLLTIQSMDDVLRAYAMGDGVVGGKRRDGRWKIHVIEFTGPQRPGAPYYLKYDIFGETDQWAEVCGNQYEVTTYFGNIMATGIDYPTEVQASFENRCADWAQLVTETVTPKELSPESPFEEFDFPIEEYEFAFVASDGLSSFHECRKTQQRKYNEDIHVLDVLRVLMDLRSFPERFMELQRGWSFKQDRKGTFPRRNWENVDDVSVGAIYCGKD